MENKKNKDPAVLFYTSDFLTGTLTMTDEHVGMYIRLLCLQHQKGRLTEKDMLYICKTYVEDVFNKFTKDASGKYYNKRMEGESLRRKAYSESRRLNVSKRKDRRRTKKNNSTYVKHMETETINETITIIKDLNYICNTNYKPTTPKTRELIKARLKEGFTTDDFKIVHRKMTKLWGNDPEMVGYLRPQTLYGTKFESYLQKIIPTNKLSRAGSKAMQVGQEWLKEKEEEENGKK
jgi:uncharacterized phage protein (TIGR02220 family)